MENAIPSVRIGRNIPSENLRKIEGETHYYNKKLGTLVQFPRIGAFEIYCGEHLIFSKLESGMWPSAKSILTIIKKIIECTSRGSTQEEFFQYQQTTTLEVKKNRHMPKEETPEKNKDNTVISNENSIVQSSVVSPQDRSRGRSTEKKNGNQTDQDNSN